MHTRPRPSLPHRPVLLLGTGERALNAHALLSIAAGYRLVLADPAVPEWARPYGTAEVPGGGSVDGVVTYRAEQALPVAELARRLGLPGNSPQAVATCEDAAATLRVLRAHDVPSLPVGTAGAAEETSEAADGVDIGVEAVVVAPGDVRTIAVTRTTQAPASSSSSSSAPLGHSVDAHDEALHDDALHHLVGTAATALGLTLGPVHLDVRLTARGPRVLRVGAHLAPGLVPLLVDRATGVSLPRVAADLAAGAVPDLTSTRKRVAAVRFLYPSASGELVRRVPPTELACAPWLDRFAWTAEQGRTVQGPPDSGPGDRLAHWVTTAADPAAGATRLDRVAEHTTARIRRRPAPR
ncbi:hypothetical protein OK074_5387 [Actinobacteria bacterium OK074]|nr:hypothetical protein OK074_5387 [Actinobacteria bacterium OK074]